MSFAEDMLDMLTSAYNRTDRARIAAGQRPETNIGKLFYLSGWGFDLIKSQAEKVRLWDDIDMAIGQTLDRIGANYGVPRGEASDEIYRIMIKVKILAMLAAGNLDTLIYAAASLFDVNPEDVQADEIYPAKVYLYIDEDKLDQEHKDVAGVIAALMHRIKAAGIGLRIFYRTYSTKQTNVYLGIATNLATFLTFPPIPVSGSIKRTADIRLGVGTMTYITASYPALH